MTPAITIPQEIIESAKQGISPLSAAGQWLEQLLQEHGLDENTSPADYPPAVWEAFKTLSEAKFHNNPPQFTGESLKKLFANSAA